MRKILFPILALLLLTGCAPRRSAAQFIGYSSPQTVQQTLATAVSCTGAAQNFVVQNLGQTQHIVLYTTPSSPVSISVVITGRINALQNQISDVATSIPGGQLLASGYYPLMQVVVTCGSAVGTFSIEYTGTSVTPIPPSGALQQSQLIKTLVTGVSLGSNRVGLQVQSPFGNSGGLLVLNPSGAVPAGSTLNVNCDAATSLNQFSFTFSLTTSAQPQVFSVPAVPCSIPQVGFTSGGASANTFDLKYVYSIPGSQSTVDPCSSPSVAKSSAVVTAPAAATTQIIAGVAGQQIFVCGYNVGVVVAVAGTLQWTTGTGGTCGAATVAKTGAIPINTAEPFSYGPGSTLFTAAAGSGVCITLTGAGDNGAGIIDFVQQ